MGISQSDAVDAFGVPVVPMYVCDGKRACGKPSCHDFSDKGACHHTSDPSHALYSAHDMDGFERYPAVFEDHAAVICVEPVRG